MEQVSLTAKDDGPQVKVFEAAAVAIAKHVAKVQREVSAELRSKPTAHVPREELIGGKSDPAAQAAARRKKVTEQQTAKAQQEERQHAALDAKRNSSDATDAAKTAKADATRRADTTTTQPQKTADTEHNTGLTGEAPQNRDVAPGTHLDIVA